MRSVVSYVTYDGISFPGGGQKTNVIAPSGSPKAGGFGFLCGPVPHVNLAARCVQFRFLVIVVAPFSSDGDMSLLEVVR